MEDKIIEAISYVRTKVEQSVTKEKQSVTKEKTFNFITNTSIYQVQLMEAFESMKAIVVIFSKPQGKRESYFVTNNNNNSWIISNKSPAKI